MPLNQDDIDKVHGINDAVRERKAAEEKGRDTKPYDEKIEELKAGLDLEHPDVKAWLDAGAPVVGTTEEQRSVPEVDNPEALVPDYEQTMEDMGVATDEEKADDHAKNEEAKQAAGVYEGVATDEQNAASSESETAKSDQAQASDEAPTEAPADEPATPKPGKARQTARATSAEQAAPAGSKEPGSAQPKK
jgi:hypothetical protein